MTSSAKTETSPNRDLVARATRVESNPHWKLIPPATSKFDQTLTPVIECTDKQHKVRLLYGQPRRLALVLRTNSQWMQSWSTLLWPRQKKNNIQDRLFLICNLTRRTNMGHSDPLSAYTRHKSRNKRNTNFHTESRPIAESCAHLWKPSQNSNQKPQPSTNREEVDSQKRSAKP